MQLNVTATWGQRKHHVAAAHHGLHAFAVQMIGLLCSRQLSLAVLFVLIIRTSSTPPAPTAPTAPFIPAAPDATRQSKAGEAAALDLLADAQQMASQALERVYEADARIRAMMSHAFYDI